VHDPLVLRYAPGRVEDEASPVAAQRRLRLQLQALLSLGHHPATFSGALLAPHRNRLLAVTFDGDAPWLDHVAVPVLASLGVPGTLFVRSGAVRDWGRLRALADAGWELGSLTRSGARLTGRDASDVAAELARSRAAIEEALGCACTSVAYPEGAVDGQIALAARRAGYRAGAGLDRLRAAHVASTRMRWGRVAVDPDDLLRFGVRTGAAVRRARGQRIARPEPHEQATLPDADGEPRVAVVIPCFNDGALAVEAVASIEENQPVEVVVVDDASTAPETAAALAALEAEGIRVLRHEHNRGLSAARRTGLQATVAPYVLPLDADDLLFPGTLGQLAERLDAEPRAVAVWGDIVTFGTSAERGTTPVWLDPYRVAFRNEYPVCSLFRRSALEAVGAWQDVGGQVGYEDWRLWMTFAERGALAVHAGPGVLGGRYRLHGPRMFSDAAERHRALYGELRRLHPILFSSLAEHRRASDLSPLVRLAYPLLYGGRPPLGLRGAADRALAAVGLRRQK
jgi:peptidoglycan/xylan/chitin deacetylase (PgdA/CDA1 family)